MGKREEKRPERIPWRDNSSFVSTFYSILTAMVGAIMALAIGDPEIKNSWYLPIALLGFSLTVLILGLEKCGEAMDEDDVDKYLAWLLMYNLGTVAMFFGISTYVVLHYRPPWAVFVTVQALAFFASLKWLGDTWYLLFRGEADYEAYREELLGTRLPEKDPDWLMNILCSIRQSKTRKQERGNRK